MVEFLFEAASGCLTVETDLSGSGSSSIDIDSNISGSSKVGVCCGTLIGFMMGNFAFPFDPNFSAFVHKSLQMKFNQKEGQNGGHELAHSRLCVGAFAINLVEDCTFRHPISNH